MGGGMGFGGGYSPMPMMHQPMMSPMMSMKGSFGGGGGAGGPWMCSGCGFKNSDRNEVCGGSGPMGCKMPQDGGMGRSMAPMGFKGKGGMGKMMGKMDMGFKGMDKGKGKGKGKGEWSCEACGFNNKPMNEVCGGKGPMGCKNPKPMDWLCECGFVNKPHNAVCGGSGGTLGCKAPKPSEEGLE